MKASTRLARIPRSNPDSLSPRSQLTRSGKEKLGPLTLSSPPLQQKRKGRPAPRQRLGGKSHLYQVTGVQRRPKDVASALPVTRRHPNSKSSGPQILFLIFLLIKGSAGAKPLLFERPAREAGRVDVTQRVVHDIGISVPGLRIGKLGQRCFPST
jgi:hypothetical protein